MQRYASHEFMRAQVLNVMKVLSAPTASEAAAGITPPPVSPRVLSRLVDYPDTSQAYHWCSGRYKPGQAASARMLYLLSLHAMDRTAILRQAITEWPRFWERVDPDVSAA